MKSKDTYYPIVVPIKDKQVVIAGAGHVAETKVNSFLGTYARITLVAPQCTPLIKQWARQKKIRFIQRQIQKGDLKKADMVIAATSSMEVNRKVSRWAQDFKILVNVADKPLISSFISPAILRVGEAVVAVHTNGKNPRFSKDLKNFIKAHWKEFKLYRKNA